jgi:hypothetical protein
MPHHLITGHEAVGIVAGIDAPGELDGPVRRDQTEAVPAVTPSLSHPRPLNDDVLNPESGELMADRQARLPAPDHRDPDPLAHASR